MKRKNSISIIILSATLMLVPFFYSCSQGNEAIAESARPVIRPARTIRISSSDGYTTRILPGTAQALQDTQLSFRVGGPLINLDTEKGRYIEQNDIIAKIDPRDFLVQINTLKARLDASRAQLAESRLQYNRYKKLIQDNAAAKSTYDQIKAAFEMAEAQVREDSENLKNARNALDDTILHAPFSGYVDTEFVENHQIVTAGQPIISMVDLSAVEVEVALPEDMLPDTGYFESYTCRFNALPDKTFEARFKEIGKQPNPSSRTYPLTLTIVDDRDTLIRPGMAAEVSINISGKNQDHLFSVPVAAVGNDAGRQTFVWIVDPDTGALGKKNVQVHGFAENGKISISGDISDGNRIVVAGVNSLTTDQKVRIMDLPNKSNIGNEL